MSHEVSIHDAQTSVMRELLFSPSLKFSDLQKGTGLDSKHANFHIQRLVDLGYLEKLIDGTYALTTKGKEHANKLDTDTNTVEKQPKVSVVVLAERLNDDGVRELLCQQRLKNPFFGYWGRFGGKVRWGESLEEAANREMLEETGLQADFTFKTLYHKRDFNADTKDVLEDKMFMLMQASNIKGELIERFEGGLNKWMTLDELKSQDKYFVSAAEFQELADSGIGFVEKDFYNDPADY